MERESTGDVVLVLLACGGTALLFGLPSLAIAYLVLTRPHLQNLFTISTSVAHLVTGILSPATVVGSALIAIWAEEGKEPACALLVTLRAVKAYIWSSVLCGNILFRFIYVCYADRGLVRQGRVELVLANLLYLVLVSTAFFAFFAIFPLPQYFDRNLHNLHFPDNTFQGRICLQRQTFDFLGPHTHRENIKQRLLTLVTSAVFFIYVIGFKFKVERFVTSTCLNKTSFAAFGGRRRRNMYSFKEEVVLFKSIVIFNFVWSAFTLLAAKFPEFFSPPVVFYIINLIFFSYQDIFQGVILPLYVLFKGNRAALWTKRLPQRRNVAWSTQTKCILPRRDFGPLSTHHNSLSTYHNNLSSYHNKNPDHIEQQGPMDAVTRQGKLHWVQNGGNILHHHHQHHRGHLRKVLPSPDGQRLWLVLGTPLPVVH